MLFQFHIYVLLLVCPSEGDALKDHLADLPSAFCSSYFWFVLLLVGRTSVEQKFWRKQIVFVFTVFVFAFLFVFVFAGQSGLMGVNNARIKTVALGIRKTSTLELDYKLLNEFIHCIYHSH